MADYYTRSRQVGRRIAAARQTAGLSAADLAERLQWPRDTLVNYETGRRRLMVESLPEIAHALDMPAAVLLLDDPALASLITRLTREPEMIEDVGFFLDARGDELPES
jgi:transcriptional regulator with XRE-family HTH domain